jgi:hypothetical protein
MLQAFNDVQKKIKDQFTWSSNPSILYSQYARFEIQLGHWLSCLRFLALLLSPSWQIQGQYVKLGQDRFLPYTLQFLLYYLSFHSPLYKQNY